MAPEPVAVAGSGSAVFALDAKTSGGWLVSRVSGDLEPPAVLLDGGQLSAFAAGDSIRIQANTTCQPFSGCKSTAVVRDSNDDSLITASMYSDSSSVPGSGDLVGDRFTLEAQCRVPIVRNACFQDEIDTSNALLIDADTVVRIAPGSRAAITLRGRTYDIWFGGAITVTGGAALVPNSCIDAASFFLGGAVSIEIAPGVRKSS